MIRKKRGISALIATILMIVIVIAAAGIIYTTVMRTMRTGTGSTTACIGKTLLIEPSQFTCYNKSGNTTKVQVSAEQKIDELTAVELLITDKNGNTAVVTEKDVDTLRQGGAKVFSINHKDHDLALDPPVKIQVKPVLLVEGREVTCPITDERTEIPECVELE